MAEITADTMYDPQAQAWTVTIPAQQLHHLARKADGWPTDELPIPDRSNWR
jgi:hypothetical protein